MKEADHESVQVCVHRFTAFLQACGELDRVLASEILDAVRRDDGVMRDRVLALAESCVRDLRERSGWRLDDGDVLPLFAQTVRVLTAEMRSVLEDFAKRRKESEPPREAAGG